MCDSKYILQNTRKLGEGWVAFRPRAVKTLTTFVCSEYFNDSTWSRSRPISSIRLFWQQQKTQTRLQVSVQRVRHVWGQLIGQKVTFSHVVSAWEYFTGRARLLIYKRAYSSFSICVWKMERRDICILSTDSLISSLGTLSSSRFVFSCVSISSDLALSFSASLIWSVCFWQISSCCWRDPSAPNKATGR